MIVPGNSSEALSPAEITRQFGIHPSDAVALGSVTVQSILEGTGRGATAVEMQAGADDTDMFRRAQLSGEIHGEDL